VKITACIIALDEEDRIEGAVESVRGVCDEVIVVDGGSRDGTRDRAKRAGAVVLERAFDDFTPQKNFANSQAAHPWILSLDSDERVSPELAAELNALKSREPESGIAAYAFPRHTYYLGRLIRHNWYPDIKPRLFRKDRAAWKGEFVHEALTVDGRTERLQGPLRHDTYRDISDHVRRIDLYTSRAAMKMQKQGRRASCAGYVLLPPWTFFRFYVLRAGLLDGWPGFVIAALSSYSVMLKYLKLREMQAAR